MTRRHPKGDTKPTTTILVQELLQALDDFATVQTIAQRIGRTNNQVAAALIWLRKCGQVDSTESGDRLWWCAASAPDPRKVVLAEITAEQIIKPTRRRRVSSGKEVKP